MIALDYISAMTIFGHDAYIKVCPNGTIEICGTIQNAARALFEYILEEVKCGAIGIELNGAFRASCHRGKPYTLTWVGRSIHSDEMQPAPVLWNEFKREFDRLGKLKALL
jgi:hypothetical protein